MIMREDLCEYLLFVLGWDRIADLVGLNRWRGENAAKGHPEHREDRGW
jgi:hypothetical protein